MSGMVKHPLGTAERLFDSFDLMINVLPEGHPRIMELIERKLRIAELAMYVHGAKDVIPKQYQGNLPAAELAVNFGESLGLSMIQSLQNVAVIGGRCSLYGDGLAAVVQQHKDFEDMSIEWAKKEVTKTSSVTVWEYNNQKGKKIPTGTKEVKVTVPDWVKVTVSRKGRKPYSYTFYASDMDTNPNWSSNKDGPWKTATRRMMMQRARSFALRDTFPDKLMGIYDEQEMSEIGEIYEVKLDSKGSFSLPPKEIKETQFAPSKKKPPSPDEMFSNNKPDIIIEPNSNIEPMDDISIDPHKEWEGYEDKRPKNPKTTPEPESTISEPEPIMESKPVETHLEDTPKTIVESPSKQEETPINDIENDLKLIYAELKMKINGLVAVKIRGPYATKIRGPYATEFNTIKYHKTFTDKQKFVKYQALNEKVITYLSENS